MQKPPRLTLVLGISLISLCCLQLWKPAAAWQDVVSPRTETTAPSVSAKQAAPVASPEASGLLTKARDRLSQHRSVKASLIERADLSDRRMVARGTFRSGEFPRTRLEYEVHVGDSVGTLLEICDGQILHIQRTIGRPETDTGTAAASGDDAAAAAARPVVEYIRRDVQQILRTSAAGQNESLPMHAADLGLGGLSAVLASLERSMVFESLRTEQHEGREFQVLEGRWNPDFLADMMAKLGPPAQQMVPFLPDRIRVELESESLFPVRILYLKLVSQERKTYRPMVSLEFHDVEFDVELPENTFEYRRPEGIEPVDDTGEFVQLLKGPPAPVEPSSAAPAPR